MGSSRARRSRRTVALAVAIACGGVTIGACIIADPPTDLPRPSERRPTVVRASVVPSTSFVLGRWPSKFIVPVELSDPLAEISWATFIDYNPITGEGFIQNETSKYEPASTRGNIRVLEIPITAPSLDRCHFVEVIVALRLNTSDPRNAHTPEAPGGDSVGWFFSPGGDLAGCPVLDAGLPPLSDAGADAEAGGIEP
ncbi:MAG: hypothetical protein KF795_06145 [Labilithrix sp.]|nr:hypothetical protein [Labilithrix sp.]